MQRSQRFAGLAGENIPQNVTTDFYTYSATLPSLAFGESGSAFINIEADANFVVMQAVYFADIAGAVQTADSRVIPLLKVAITDSGSGRNLQNEAVPIANIAGSGALPFVWPVQRTFKANATINVNFENYSAATTYANIFLTFIGYKNFRY